MFGVTSLFYCLKIHPFEYALSNEKDLYIINHYIYCVGFMRKCQVEPFVGELPFCPLTFTHSQKNSLVIVMLWTVFLICDDWKQFEASCTVQEC